MFSIVMPLYNKEAYVGRAIRSVLAQTCRDWELLVVDDGSTDRGAALVRSFGDSRIRCLSQENQGPSEARNRGIDEASKPYIAFLDADDEWLPNHLDDIRRLTEACPDAAIFGQAYYVDNGSGLRLPTFVGIPRGDWQGVIPNYFLSAKPGHHPLWTGAVVVPAAVLRKIGGFPRNVPRGQDLECWSLAALEGPAVFSRNVGAVYHNDTSNGHGTRKRLIGRRLGVEIALAEGRVPRRLIHGVRVYVQRTQIRWYSALIKDGRLQEAAALRKQMGFPRTWELAWVFLIWRLLELVPADSLGGIVRRRAQRRDRT
jgi:glycosyltransferase involved in cell wall biosynthesis